MKILLAVDGSAHTKKMLAYLATHEDVFGKADEYVAFHVQMALPPRVRSAVGKEVVTKYHSDEAEKVLGPVCKFLARHDMTVKSSWKVGPPGETIAKFAQEGKFDLVVMGSHGHGALMNLVMGSVATQVMANCKVPLLIVR
jgi:nucleotide-binding universal stress UspA family protein